MIESENPWPKRFVYLRFAAKSDDLKKRANIRLAESYVSPISFELDGPEEVVDRLRRDLLDLLAGMKPWYSRVTGFNFVVLMLFLSLVVFVLSNAAFAFGWIKTLNLQHDWHRTASIIALLLTAGVIGAAALRRGADWLFPAGVFLIGQAQKRHDTLEKVRWTVVIGFFVSVAGSVFAALRL